MSKDVLQQLLEGNRRYAAEGLTLDASAHRRTEVTAGQQPCAIILGCVDSRVPPELIFDQGLGELFVIRTAGQVLDKAALGSLEFGVAELHIPLLVVLGHEHCGAVKAAIETLEQHEAAEADIAYLVEALTPAVRAGEKAGGDVWDSAVRAQIMMLVEELKRSPVLSAAVEAGKLKIVGAWYSLETGLVEITVA
ncbi:MAG: carbonic anhydrase [Anaerolineae bacterium]|jgi:carbonic anhydrase|nr:carbonic anhydrase [Anaerolineae bacterium]